MSAIGGSPHAAVPDLVAAAVLRAGDKPGALAACDASRRWTWGEVLADAHAWRDAVAGACAPGQLAVPMLVRRSARILPAALGCMMAGRAFAPLSPDQPPERLALCAQCVGGIGIDLVARPDAAPSECMREFAPPGPVAAVKPEGPVEDPLYVLFTSGSTGRPKGVVVTGTNITNMLTWWSGLHGYAPSDIAGVATPFFFDISMFDVFACIGRGVPMAVLSDLADVRRVVAEVEAYGVTTLFSVPTFYSQWLRLPDFGRAPVGRLRRAIIGGDFLPPAHWLAWRRAYPEMQLINIWGPTETTILNTAHLVGPSDDEVIEAEGHPPVGRAMERMQFVLVDEAGREVVEPGREGEIWMLGSCVTRGYAGGSDEEAANYTEWRGQRAFRTRDIGRLDARGQLYMVGRIGSMVKIAGHRVDLGEVEAAATSHGAVHLASAFTVASPAGHDELHLAVERRPGAGDLDIYSLKQHLRAKLPPYMVPKRIHPADALPRTANGKVSRRGVKEAFTP